MIKQEDLEKALSEKLSPEMGSFIPSLAKLLYDVLQEKPGLEDSNNVHDLLRLLNGQEILLDEYLVSIQPPPTGTGSHINVTKVDNGIAQKTPMQSIYIASGPGSISGEFHHSIVIPGDFFLMKWDPVKPVSPGKLARAQRFFKSMAHIQVLQDERGNFPAGSFVPFRRNPFFVGREPFLLSIRDALIENYGVVINGIGGIGKTQLAVEFAFRYAQYFAGGVFWLNFANPDFVKMEVANCGGQRGMNLRPNFYDLPLDEQVEMVRREWLGPLPRLLIIDNCEDDALLNRWLPNTGGCRALITSRKDDWDPLLKLKELQPLREFSREESITLLRKFRDIPLVNIQTLDAIAEEVGDLPLAIHLAGRYLYDTRKYLPAEEYLSLLRGPPILMHPSLLEGAGLSPTEHPLSVLRTFELSYQRLLETDPSEGELAQHLLDCAAWLAPGELIPPWLLTETIPSEQFTSSKQKTKVAYAFRRLTQLGLLESNYQSNELRLHRLLSAFVHLVTPSEKLKAAFSSVEKAVGGYLLDIILSGETSKKVVFIRSHIIVVLSKIVKTYQETGDFNSAASLLSSFGKLLTTWGANQTIIDLYQLLNEKEMHPRLVMISLLSQGNAYFNLGKTEEAYPFYKQAWDAFNKIDEPYPEDRSSLLGVMGNYYANIGEYTTALDYYHEALCHSKDLPDSLKGQYAKWLLNVAQCYLFLGLFKNTIDYHEKVVLFLEQISDRESVPKAIIQEISNNFVLQKGALLYRQGEIDKACSFYEVSLEQAKDAGNLKLEVLSIANIGYMHLLRGNPDTANQTLETALKLTQKNGLKPFEPMIWHSFAEMSMQNNQVLDAIRFAQRGFDIAAKTRDPIAICENSIILITCAFLLNDLNVAERFLQDTSSFHLPLYLPLFDYLKAVFAFRKEDQTEAYRNFYRAKKTSEALLSHNTKNFLAKMTFELSSYGMSCLSLKDDTEPTNKVDSVSCINCAFPGYKQQLALLGSLIKNGCQNK